MHNKDPKIKIIVMLLALCVGISYMHPFAFAEDMQEALSVEDAADDMPDDEVNASEPSDDAVADEDDVANVEEDAKAEKETGSEENKNLDEQKEIKDEERAAIIEEAETEDKAFNADKADYLAYDPLYIAKYANPKYVDVSHVDLSRFYDVVTAAKGIATYNVKKQSDFDVTEKNYIAGLTYEMPVYNIDDDSKYYVAIPNVNKFNSNFKAYDIDVAYNNDCAEMIAGYKYEKGILYIPKSAIDKPKNKEQVPKGSVIAVQLNYAIGGDMDFSKSIPVQILSSEEPLDKTAHVSNIFDVDNLSVSTGIKGRKESDISIYLNGNLIPVNKGFWEYDRSSGRIDIKTAPGVVSNINVIFKQRTFAEKAKDLAANAIETVTPAAFAAVPMEDMNYFRTENGTPIRLDIRSNDIFVGWRGHFSGKYIWGNSNAKQNKRNNSPGYTNSVKYLYGGQTNATGATGNSNIIASAWAISSYAIAYNMDNDSNQGSLEQGDMVVHLNTLNGNTESKTIYEWMLTYRDQLEQSKLEYGAGHSNGLGGTNNFAFTLPKVVTGASTTLVSSGEDAGRTNKSIQFLSDEITAAQGSNSTSIYYDYWIAAGCNHLDMAQDDDLDAQDNDIYVTCLGLGADYAVLAFVQSNGGSATQNACGIYKFMLAPTGYVTIKKNARNTGTDFLKEASNNYSLNGAVYYLYTDEACTARAKDAYGDEITFTTDANGNTPSVAVEPGTYYAKEVKASKGFMLDKELNAGKKAIKVTENDAMDNPVTVNSIEEPVYVDLPVIAKKNYSGEAGWRKMLGAEYTLRYYDVDPSTTDVSSYQYKRSWIFKTVEKKDGKDSYAGIDFNNDDKVSGDDFYTVAGKRIMPCGVYTIEETKAPAGMARNTGVYYGKVYQPSNAAEAEARFNTKDAKDMILDVGSDQSATNDEDLQGIVINILKVDAETGKAEAQGTGRDNVKGSLAGGRFNIYYDSEEYPKPELVGIAITDDSGKATVTKRTEGNENFIGESLRPGWYQIEEVAAPAGYVIDKLTVKEKKNVYENGRHIIRARVKEGDTATFEYGITSEDAPHHTIIHKTDIATGKELPGATLQVIDSEENIVEEWVSEAEPHDIACLHDETQGLKDGKYTLREITAPYGYDVAEDVSFEVKSDVIENTVEMQNKPVNVETTALDIESETHQGVLAEDAQIKDTVKITGLYKGRVYQVKGRLIDKSTGEVLKDKEGNDVTAETEEFTATGDEMEIELTFRVDSSIFTKDTTAVAFEKLYRTSAVHAEAVPVEISKHEDPEDEDQTIHYGGIVKTIATDEATNSHILFAKEEAGIVDTVEYKNLSPNETYTLRGDIYDKTEGRLMGIKTEAEFTPKAADGKTTVRFSLDAKELAGHELVVYETLLLKDKVIDKHEDPEDRNQTVHVVGYEMYKIRNEEASAKGSKYGFEPGSVITYDVVIKNNSAEGFPLTMDVTDSFVEGGEYFSIPEVIEVKNAAQNSLSSDKNKVNITVEPGMTATVTFAATINSNAKEYLAGAAGDSDSLDKDGNNVNRTDKVNETDDNDGYKNIASTSNVTTPDPYNPGKTVTLESKDDDAQTPVKVKASKKSSPQTGDNNTLMLYGAMIILAISVLSVVLHIRRLR